MRCPYCGSFNQDNVGTCVRCGRAISPQAVPPVSRQPQPLQPPPQRPQPPQAQPQRPGYPPPPQPQRPAYPPPQPPQPVTPMQAPSMPQPASSRRMPQRAPVMPTPVVPPPPSEPEPPGPFPPRTTAQMWALESGAQDYTLVSDTVGNGRKRIVRIAYKPSGAWIQVATLLKALKEYQTDKFETIIVQGVQPQNVDVYAYTNGQIVLDRNVRLGSQVLTRYQIETGTGLQSDSLRIVLSE